MTQKLKERKFEELEKKYCQLPDDIKIISPSEVIDIAIQIDRLMGELESRVTDQTEKLEEIAVEKENGEIKINNEYKELLLKYDEVFFDTITKMRGSDACHILRGC